MGCFPLDDGAYPPPTDSEGNTYSIRSLIGFGRLVGPLAHLVLYPCMQIYLRLAQKLFRGEPDITEFDKPFTPNHSSSKRFSTHISSDLHRVLPRLHPGHG